MISIVPKSFDIGKFVQNATRKSKIFSSFLQKYIVYDTETYIVKGKDYLKLKELKTEYDVHVDEEKLRIILNTVMLDDNRDFTIHLLKLGVAFYVENGEIKEELRFRKPAEFSEFVNRIAEREGNIALIAHNHNFDMRTTGIDIELVKRYGWNVKYGSLKTGGFIVMFRKGDKSIYGWDTLNVFPDSLENLSKYTKTKKVEIEDFTNVDDETLMKRCYNDVMITYEVVELYKRISKELNIKMLPTLSQMSILYLLEKNLVDMRFSYSDHISFIGESIQSYRGGRTEIFYQGTIKEPVYVLDVNSLYPYVMYQYSYPIKLYKMLTNPGVDEIYGYIKQGFNVLADTEMNFDGEIGVKYNDRLVFPKGYGRVSINTQEVKYAIENKLIREIKRAWIFKSSRLFESMKELYEKRKQFKSEGRDDLQFMVKILMNSGYGRFGYQRELSFQYNGDEPYELLVNIANEYGLLGTIHWLVTGYLIVLNKVLIADVLPIIAAEVSANGRMYITNYKLLVEKYGGKVYYMDTDSLFVDQRGYEILNSHGAINPNEFGKLKHEKTYDILHINAPKNYKGYYQGKLISDKKKGISKYALEIEDNVYKQEQSLGVAMSRDVIDYGLIWYDVIKKNSNKYDKGIVREDGSVEPLLLENYNVDYEKPIQVLDYHSLSSMKSFIEHIISELEDI